MKQIKKFRQFVCGLSRPTKMLIHVWAAIIVTMLTASIVLDIGAGTIGNYYVFSAYRDDVLICLRPALIICVCCTAAVEYIERKSQKNE